jgi:hypothetical protein
MKTPMEPSRVCAVLSGQTKSGERTNEIAHAFRNCPCTYFMATEKNRIFAVMFITPKRARIWTENQKKNPRAIFGLEKAKVAMVSNVQYPRELRLRLPREPKEKTPCGLNCAKCPAYKECTGCPVMIFYKKSKNQS